MGLGARQVGGALVVAGLVLVAVGAAVRFGWLSWFGRLPGDLRLEGEHTRVLVPVTSMILVSIVLSVAAWIVRRLS